MFNDCPLSNKKKLLITLSDEPICAGVKEKNKNGEYKKCKECEGCNHYDNKLEVTFTEMESWAALGGKIFPWLPPPQPPPESEYTIVTTTSNTTSAPTNIYMPRNMGNSQKKDYYTLYEAFLTKMGLNKEKK